MLPFLLFSSFAGKLADRISKNKLIMYLKLSEVFIMILGMFALGVGSSWASYTLLFLLSTQSALFSPPKYSIIPELVEEDGILKAAQGITTIEEVLRVVSE